MGAQMNRELICYVESSAEKPPLQKLLEIVGFEQVHISTLGEVILEPKDYILLAVGDGALNYLTGYERISDYQGSRFLVEAQEIIPIRSPLELISHHSWLDLILTLQILKRVRDGSWVPQPPMSDDFFTDDLRRADRWAFDLEVRGREIKEIGIAFKLQDQWAWKSFHNPSAQTWRWMSELLKINPRVVGHNFLSFDAEWLKDQGVELSSFDFDTMLGFGFLYPELPKDLASAIRWFGLGNFHKGKEKEKDLGALSRLDALRTLQLSYEIEGEVFKSGRLEEWAQCMELMEAGLRAQNSPLRVNLQKVDERSSAIRAQLKALKKELVKELDLDPLSVSSLRKFLYGDLKLPTPSRGKKRGVKTVDDQHLKLLKINHPEIPYLSQINKVRELTEELEGLPIHSFNGESFQSVQLMSDDLGDWSFHRSHTRLGNDLDRVQWLGRWAIEPLSGRAFFQVSLKGIEGDIAPSYFPSAPKPLNQWTNPILLGLLRLETREELSLRTQLPLKVLEPLIKETERSFGVKSFLEGVKDQLKRNGTLSSILGTKRTFLSSLGSRIGLGTVTSSVLKEAMKWLLGSPVIEIGSKLILDLHSFPEAQLHFRRGSELLFSVPKEKGWIIFQAIDRLQHSIQPQVLSKIRVSISEHWSEE